MKKASLLDDYLSRFATGPAWTLQTGSSGDADQAVVIPAYAEKNHLFDTLASLAENDAASLERTMVICVVNHKSGAPVEDRENNFQTLEHLRALVDRKPVHAAKDEKPRRFCLQKIADSSLRLGLVDACSPGREISGKDGGVGMARKIGMDAALRLLRTAGGPRLLFSLDADTLVQPHYLSAVRQAFSSRRAQTGVIAYAHQLPPDPAGQAAIVRYEIYLRYWVLGLQYAASPYAFHSIGSTMATTTDAYLAVRGMNRRAAGEDFYFLNKLAKIGPVRRISETTVYPSARASRRVPFGTGAAVGKMLSGAEKALRFYDPRVFTTLRQWLCLLGQSYPETCAGILERARAIDPELAAFLLSRGFLQIQPKIRRMVRDEKTYVKQLHGWFDGFEALKLINHLSQTRYPRTDSVRAVKSLLKKMDADAGTAGPEGGENLIDLLAFLRSRT
ncbi:MAG: hypothetical protein PHG54_01325 [Smithellaceae bacterium]|nr:hypothetical protein [Smithellaceae bacterium]